MQITTKHQQLQPIQPILQLVKQVVSTNASQGLVFTTNLAYFFGQIKKRAKKLVIQVVCTNAPQGLVFTTDLTQFLAKSKKRQIIELQDRIKLLLSHLFLGLCQFSDQVAATAVAMTFLLLIFLCNFSKILCF